MNVRQMYFPTILLDTNFNTLVYTPYREVRHEELISLKTLCNASMSSFVLRVSFKMASTLSIVGTIFISVGKTPSPGEESIDWEQGDRSQSV